MKAFFHRPFRWAVTYTAVLALFTVYVLLDTFVIPRAGNPAASANSDFFTTVSTAAPTTTKKSTALEETTANTPAGTSDATIKTTTVTAAVTTDQPVITATSYEDTNIRITIETKRADNTTYYVADIRLSGAQYLKTALAQNTYGRNIKDTTSDMAQDNNAIFAINGDYYGFRNYGFVVRNGTVYRTFARTSGITEDLVIDSEGNFSIVNEVNTSAAALKSLNAWQVFSFGPSLIQNGKITVTANSEVGQSMTSNPRTAIGQVSALHYIVIVSDGRTSASEGMSLLELAEAMQQEGCTVAYNLDGGGSSTMWFNGKIINNPTDGRSSSERSVSDIVYFGY